MIYIRRADDIFTRMVNHNTSSRMKPMKRLSKQSFKGDDRDEKDQEYLDKRAKNNAAVKRAREKSKQKQQQTNNRIQSIRRENDQLEERIKLLSAELQTMKDAYCKYTGKSIPNQDGHI